MHVTLGVILLVFAFVIAIVSSRVPVWGTWTVFPIAFAFLIAAMLFGGITLG